MKTESKVKFGFKQTTQKNEITGKPVLNEKGEEVKIPAPPPIEIDIDVFSSAEDVQAILDTGDEKEIKLLLESINDVIFGAAKSQIDDDREGVRTNGFKPDSLSWHAIAYAPPGMRADMFPDETWDAFTKDYVSVMLHHGKSQAQAESGAAYLRKKFAPVKMNKKVMTSLKSNLLIWAGNTSSEGEFSKIYEMLMARAEIYLATDEDAIVASV